MTTHVSHFHTNISCYLSLENNRMYQQQNICSNKPKLILHSEKHEKHIHSSPKALNTMELIRKRKDATEQCWLNERVMNDENQKPFSPFDLKTCF